MDKVPSVSTKGSRQVCLSRCRRNPRDFVAFRDSGRVFQQFSRDFPGVFLGNPRTDPGNSHSLLEFSDDKMFSRKIWFNPSPKQKKKQVWTSGQFWQDKRFERCFERRDLFRETPVRFGSVAVWAWNGSSGSGFRFRRFLCKKGFSVFQYSLTRKDGSGFGSWKTVPAVLVPLSVSGKTVLSHSAFSVMQWPPFLFSWGC